MNAIEISVVIPTRNPNRERLDEVLRALDAQTLARERWDLWLVDNGSQPPLRPADFPALAQLHIIREEEPGLLAARRCGLRNSTGACVVFIDDDTVPSAGFLAAAVEFMEARPQVATAGGRIVPRYLAPPPAWIDSVSWLLALRDNGPHPLEWNVQTGGPLPSWTPIGAGLLVRRSALVPGYLQHVATHGAEIARLSWRGQGLGGVEDKDLVLYCLRSGYSTGYCSDLNLVHIIPPERLTASYFSRLLPAVEAMWVKTLYAHGFENHRPVHPFTLPLRKAKAWFAFSAWRSPAHRFQWLESCGYLDGLAAVYRNPLRYAYPQKAGAQ